MIQTLILILTDLIKSNYLHNEPSGRGLWDWLRALVGFLRRRSFTRGVVWRRLVNRSVKLYSRQFSARMWLFYSDRVILQWRSNVSLIRIAFLCSWELDLISWKLLEPVRQPDPIDAHPLKPSRQRKAQVASWFACSWKIRGWEFVDLGVALFC